MKFISTYLLIILLTTTLFSCKKKSSAPITEKQDLLIVNNFMDWWAYHQNNIILSSNFVAIDHDSKSITKENFIKALTSGDFIPVKINTQDNIVHYKLQKLEKDVDSSIVNTIVNEALFAYKCYKMENTPFPDFKFTDLEGKTYTNASLKGNTILIKCWFIACKPCVEEFPRLNWLVDKMQGNDTVFISLALDNKEKLAAFLEKKPFHYKVIPGQKQYISDRLEVTRFPTHYLIDSEGVIKKVVTNIDELPLSVSIPDIIKKNIKSPPPSPIR